MDRTKNQLRILIVDDHADTVRAFTRVLSKDGHHVKGVSGCSLAVDAAKIDHFDLMLCDIGMPENDGFSCLREIRALGPINAIAITGHGTPEDIRQLTDAGFDGFFIKPIDFDQLHRTIQDLAADVSGNPSQNQKVTPKIEELRAARERLQSRSKAIQDRDRDAEAHPGS